METLFCTRQDVKKYGKVPDKQEMYDDLIDDLIRMWTANAKVFCRRDFIFGEHTELFSVLNIGRYYNVKLLEAPVVIDLEHPFVVKCNDEVVSDEYYQVNKEKGLVRINMKALRPGTDNLEITYWGGLCLDESDDNDKNIKVIEKSPLRSAIANQCGYALIRTIQSNQGQQSDKTGRSATNTTPAAMGFLPEVSLVLSNYRITLTGR